jgi:hypothetical protein
MNNIVTFPGASERKPSAQAEELPAYRIEEARCLTAMAYREMQEAARHLLICMPTDPKGLVDLLLYLEQNFSVLPSELTSSGIKSESLAFHLLRTVRLSLREIARLRKGRFVMAMTVDHLLAEAKRNSTGPAEAGDLSASGLSEFLRVVLGLVLEEIDYDADRASDGAVAARLLASMIKTADELTGMETQ